MRRTSSSASLVAWAAALAPFCSFALAREPAPPPADMIPLTVEKVLELGEEIRPEYAESLGWVDGRHYLAHDVVEGDGEDAVRALVAVDAETGSQTPLFDRERMERALGALPGIDPETAQAWTRRADLHLDDAKEAALWNEFGDLFYYRFGDDRALRLTSDPTEEGGEAFSPDGSMVAYISGYDLAIAGTDGSAPRMLTGEGDENNLVGRLDWVYQEEIYGRGNWKGFWWSPDSRRLAFLALDESPVPEYTIVDHRKNRPDVEVWRYPKAGDPNPSVRLGVIDVAGGDVRWIDLSRWGGEEFLIVRVGWTPDGQEVVVQVQNRIQTWLDLVLADPETGESRVLFRDQTGVWIEPTAAPFWIGDGEQLLWLSERDGYRHLYRYQRDGRLEGRLTEGEWEVDEVHGLDATRGVVWFSGDRDDVKGQQLFRVGLDGDGLTAVTSGPGEHLVSVSPTFDYFIDDHSALTDPGGVAVYGRGPAPLRTLMKGTLEPLEEYGLNDPEFVTLETRDGFPLEAILIKPPGFDPARKYPVWCHVYSGPHAPQVRDRFLNRNVLWHQLLAQRGYLVWVCDNRSASGKGLESVKGVYKNLGSQELADIEDGLDWLVAQGFADPERIGIWGWSYGGYMTAYALTHCDRFKIGISGAPVTDWHLYDTIYTERYMDMPQNNPDGYEASSVLKAAENLRGELLLIHGAIDENVHMQNSMQFAEALQKAGKPFELMIYPGNRHGVRQKEQRRHLYETMTRFVLEHL